MTHKHVVITGTGRAGTSFLVHLLTNLGLETGFAPGNVQLDEDARAGLEHDVRQAGAPYITKSPLFCECVEEVLQRGDIVIEHVFIAMRDVYEAAESRRRVVDTAVSKLPLARRLWSRIKPPGVQGGLWLTKRRNKQEEVLLQQIYNLILVLSGGQIPVTLLQYPRLAKDSSYLYEKLKPILAAGSFVEFSLAFDQTVRPEWIHKYHEDRGNPGIMSPGATRSAFLPAHNQPLGVSEAR